MNTQEKNKEFILNYFATLSGKPKPPALNREFMTDEKLIEHIAFFDNIFPNYEIYADEMIAEDDRVFVRARVKGIHEGDLNGIPPTHKQVEFPFAITYTIKEDMIVDHWLISDQMLLMQQLGVVEEPTAV